MTREEAIKIIKIVLAVAEDFEIIVQGEEFTEEKCKEAVEMATEALEQEPCDAVSRKEVMNMLHNHAFDYAASTKILALLKTMCGEVDRMPSVIPQYTDAEIQKMQELEQAEIQKAYEIGKEEGSSEKPNKWIPVSERLPIKEFEDGIKNRTVYDIYPCLVTRYSTHTDEPRTRIYVCKSYFDGEDFMLHGGYAPNEESDTENTLAWMPLPEPYKASPTEAEGSK